MDSKFVVLIALFALGSSTQAVTLNRFFGKTQAPAPSYQAPVQTYQAPVQSYQAPVQSYQAPVQSYQAPVQSYQAPVKASYQTYEPAVQSSYSTKGYVQSQAPSEPIVATKGTFQRFESAPQIVEREPIRQQVNFAKGTYAQQDYQAPVVATKGTSVAHVQESVQLQQPVTKSIQSDLPAVQSYQHQEAFVAKGGLTAAAAPVPVQQFQQVSAPVVQSAQQPLQQHL